MAQEVQKAQFSIFNASSYHVGIVVAQFNRDITEGLLDSALQMLAKYDVPKEHILTFRVAGSIEIPSILKNLAESQKYQCLVALGVVIRGETPHFDYVCKIVSEGILRVMLDYGISVGFGILTTNDHEQAAKRLHVGGEAAEAALQNSKLIKEMVLT